MVPYACTLGLCNDCPKNLPTVNHETVTGTADRNSRITYKTNCTAYTCPNHPRKVRYETKCDDCQRENIPAKDRPKLVTKAVVAYKNLCIGDFKDTVYPAQLRSFSQHRFLRHVLGKTWSLGQRETLPLENPGSVLCHRDYTTRLPMIPNNQVMGNGMTGTPLVGMEGMVVKFKDPTLDRLALHWFGWLSDEKQQDARTSFVNTAKLIETMQARGYLQPDEGHVLYIVSDGCAKQYKCANTLQTYNMLADRYRICIDVMITAPYHGKSLVDALAGLDKSVIKAGLRRGIDCATINDKNEPISQAIACFRYLAHEDRRYGDITDTKHKKKEGQSRVDERHYGISNYSAANPIPLKDCSFKIDADQWGDGQKNKLKEMYEYFFSPDLPLNQCAVRRIPCCCKGPGGCEEQMLSGWDFSKLAQDQKRFQRPTDCKLAPMMQDLNDWLFIQTDLLQGQSDNAKSQVNKVIQGSLDLHIRSMRAAVKSGNFGAVSSSDDEGYWLVRWTGPPHQLTEDAFVEGGSVIMPIGTWVCEAEWYRRIPYAPGWYERHKCAKQARRETPLSHPTGRQNKRKSEGLQCKNANDTASSSQRRIRQRHRQRLLREVHPGQRIGPDPTRCTPPWKTGTASVEWRG